MDVQLPACSERELEHRQTLTLLVTLYPAAKVQSRIELLAEMRVTLEATKTRFLAEGVLQG